MLNGRDQAVHLVRRGVHAVLVLAMRSQVQLRAAARAEQRHLLVIQTFITRHGPRRVTLHGYIFVDQLRAGISGRAVVLLAHMFVLVGALAKVQVDGGKGRTHCGWKRTNPFS